MHAFLRSARCTCFFGFFPGLETYFFCHLLAFFFASTDFFLFPSAFTFLMVRPLNMYNLKDIVYVFR